MPLFSIVIPCYNRAQFIGATLDSVRAQEFKDYEVIVVDDNSSDDTLKVLRSYPEAKVLKQENRGPGVARNYGVSRCVGEYVAFLDSDDIWFPWTLSSFAEVIETHSRPDLVCCKLELFWDDNQLRQIHRDPLRVHVFADYYASSRNRYFVGACMMTLKRKVFEATGGFTDKRLYAEDSDLALRLGLANVFVQILSPVTLGYRQHTGNATRDHDMIFKGMLNLIDSERTGLYPGGRARRTDRIRLITLHVRPVSLECLKDGRQARGWRLYAQTMRWHIRIARWKYLFGFPVFALGYAFRSFWRRLAAAFLG